MYITNNTDPKTEPCGTPHLIGGILELDFYILRIDIYLSNSFLIMKK